MKKRLFDTGVSALILVSLFLFPMAAYPQNAVKSDAIKSDAAKNDSTKIDVTKSDAKPDYEKLKKDYDAVVADRDNILTQAKTLLEFKNKAKDVEEETKKLTQSKEQAEKNLQARLEQINLLNKKIEDLESGQEQLTQENLSLKNSLEKKEIEYRILPETNKELISLRKENSELLRKYKLAENNTKRLEEQKLDASAQAEIYRRQLNDLKKQYNEALAKNRGLEKKAEAVPGRVAELARENKILKKETALMHYNLGVFYTQNKEYARGEAEFEKAIEINPDDPYAHYNLGYIYSEYLVNRPKAIEQFRQFLRLSKTEDKDVDWVRKYILTWQTWEGKKPVE